MQINTGEVILFSLLIEDKIRHAVYTHTRWKHNQPEYEYFKALYVYFSRIGCEELIMQQT